eukprot:1983095-Rhodomonas_salina.1
MSVPCRSRAGVGFYWTVAPVPAPARPRPSLSQDPASTLQTEHTRRKAQLSHHNHTLILSDPWIHTASQRQDTWPGTHRS